MILIISSIIILFLVISKLYFYLNCARCNSKVCLVGKTALVTGGSGGIGYQIVLALASRGCKVIVADRVINDDLKRAVVKETNNPNIMFKFVDLASFKSVRSLAESVKNSEEKLDILINNAGVGRAEDRLTEDGLNKTLQINYFSHVLLTHLLVGLLKKSSSGRIIFTSSLLCFFNNITETSLEVDAINAKYYHTSYANSKFLCILAADVFAKKLKGIGITSNSYHPWAAKTTIFASSMISFDFMGLLTYLLGMITSFSGKTPEEGAQTAIHLACANEMNGVSGYFFGELQKRFKPGAVENKQLCEKIWRSTEKLIKLESNEKLQE